jgi:tetratricopeptide (TPR) repeat protein
VVPISSPIAPRIEINLVLHLVRRVRQRLQVRRLRRQAQVDASPKSTVILCRHLDSCGRHRDAIQEAKSGLIRFPHARELGDVLRDLFRRRREDLEKRTASGAYPETALADLSELVRANVDFARLDEALKVARELVSRFPREPEALLHHGLAHKALFERDHASRDGKAALDSLRRAAELDASSLDARRALAQTYGMIGATSQALFHALLALELDPSDAATNRLYAEMRRRPLQRRAEADLLWEAEVNDQSLSEKRTVSTDRSFNALLVDGVRRLSRLRGVRRVAMQHRAVGMVATGDVLKPASDRSDLYLGSIENLRRHASAWAKRMGMGGFEEATLVLDGVAVHAVAGAGTLLALEIHGDVDVGTIAEDARNTVAGWTATEHRLLEWVR